MHIARWARFLRDYCEFKRQAKGAQVPFKFGKLYPCFEDASKPIEALGHYFHQDLLVANKIFVNNPVKHVDVGSRMDGLVAHVASFREIEVIDIRPLEVSIPNIKFRQADVTSSDIELKDYCDSLSSLHAVEHFGLGRYGDRIDFDGYLRGLDRLYEILKERGKFYFSVPMGDPRIEFNAHRVFSLKHVLDLFDGKYELDSFSYVNDEGNLVRNPRLVSEDIENSFSCHYGCAIFELTKVKSNGPFFEPEGIETGTHRGKSWLERLMPRRVRRGLADNERIAIDDRSIQPPTRAEMALLEDLRKTFRNLPVEQISGVSSPDEIWKQHLNRLRELVLGGNPREFLRWDIILGTMFVATEPYIKRELDHLRQRPDWNDCWNMAIEEVEVGHPIPFYEYPRSSGNLIHHAYHISQFEQKTGLKASGFDYVFEFGAGYGSMCRLIHNLKFDGKYVIFDLPHFTALQNYYLQSVGISVHEFDSFNCMENGVVCVSDLEKLKRLLTKNDDKGYSNSLFVATWSISEAPLELRDEIFRLVTDFDSYLLAYQNAFGGIDNIEYFDKAKGFMKDVGWNQWEIEHLPRNYYLVGSKVGK